MVLNLYKSSNDSVRKTLFRVGNCLPKSWQPFSLGLLPCVSFTDVLCSCKVYQETPLSEKLLSWVY